MLFHLDPAPPSGEAEASSSEVELLLFRGVTNAPAIRKLVVSGGLQAAALNASLVLDPFHVLAATQHAVLKLHADKLTSRTVHTEVIYNISASRNIGKALTQFGVSDACSAVLFVIHAPTASALTAVRRAVDGEEVADVAAGLREGADLCAVRVAYAIEKREEDGGLLEAVVTRIAVRDVR